MFSDSYSIIRFNPPGSVPDILNSTNSPAATKNSVGKSSDQTGGSASPTTVIETVPVMD